MCIFFGRKIKGRKIKKMRFSAPKTKKKTKFGRPLIRVPFFEKNSVNKYHRECIKTHHFDIRRTKIFWGGLEGGQPPALWRSTSGAPFRWIGHQPL